MDKENQHRHLIDLHLEYLSIHIIVPKYNICTHRIYWVLMTITCISAIA